MASFDRRYFALALLLGSLGPVGQTANSATAMNLNVLANPDKVLPTITAPDYTKTVLKPLFTTQYKLLTDCDNAGGSVHGDVCDIPPPPPPPAPAEPSMPDTSSQTTVDEFIGALGYSLAGGNCVDEPGINNPGWGNPIDWPVLTETPSIGATVLFYYNHTAVVSGIWPNGDVEVRQQNCPGCATRYSQSMIRGYR